jgi:hypothetical protein
LGRGCLIVRFLGRAETLVSFAAELLQADSICVFDLQFLWLALQALHAQRTSFVALRVKKEAPGSRKNIASFQAPHSRVIRYSCCLT